MNEDQIQKFIALGRKKKLNATQLSQLLTEPPHNLCVADASVVYFAYLRRYPVTRAVDCLPTKPLETPLQAAKRTAKVWKKALKPGKFPSDAGNVFRDSGTVSAAPATPGYSPSKLNRSAVKAYALDFSGRTRAGKFKRVSPVWVRGVEAELENVIRAIGGPEDSEELPGEWDFLNRKQILASVFEQLNRAVRKIILRKVRSHPSKGQTLK